MYDVNDIQLTPAELAAIHEMGYSVEDIKRLKKDRSTWHVPKKEAFDELLVKQKDDVVDELNFDR